LEIIHTNAMHPRDAISPIVSTLALLIACAADDTAQIQALLESTQAALDAAMPVAQLHLASAQLENYSGRIQ
jgi:hypothetical protein